jgi:hypothetical protein
MQNALLAEANAILAEIDALRARAEGNATLATLLAPAFEANPSLDACILPGGDNRYL